MLDLTCGNCWRYKDPGATPRDYPNAPVDEGWRTCTAGCIIRAISLHKCFAFSEADEIHRLALTETEKPKDPITEEPKRRGMRFKDNLSKMRLDGSIRA